jgi:hypothetical protein
MRATHVLILISSIALFAWTRSAPPALEGPRGLLELRHNLLILGNVQLGDRQVDVNSRLGNRTPGGPYPTDLKCGPTKTLGAYCPSTSFKEV